MTKLTVCVGISGSGKSHWAQQQKQLNPNLVIVERDDIWEELYPGYWKQNPDSKKEKIVTKIQRERLKTALESGLEQVIISDTNLNEKYLYELLDVIHHGWGYNLTCQSKALQNSFPLRENPFIKGNLQVEFKYFDQSNDLELCVKRNRKRERYVPESVICDQWKHYQKLTTTGKQFSFDSSFKPVVVISDLHGQWAKYKQIKDKYKSTHTVISIGDVNDCRVSSYKESGISSYTLLNSFYISYLAGEDIHLLHSNHQKNLINVVRGRREKLGYGMKDTVDELVDLGLFNYEEQRTDEPLIDKTSVQATDSLLDLVNFLDTRPSCVQLMHQGQEWRLAHAFVPVGRSQPRPFDPYPKQENQYIYSPRTNDPDWVNKCDSITNLPFRVIVGHSHQEYYGKNIWVVGPEDESVIAVTHFESEQEPYVEYF